MTVLDDAYTVLLRAGEPLHYREIAHRMLQAGWDTSGSTPHFTVHAALNSDVKRNGSASRFIGPFDDGYFRINPALRETETPAQAAAQPEVLTAPVEQQAGVGTSSLDYAYRILGDAGGPLHYREITTRMLAAGWQTNGKTPWETVNARLAVDVKQHGEASRFMRTTPGHFTLNPNPALAPTRTRPAPSPGTGEGWGEGAPSADRPDGQRGQMSFSDAAEHILRESGGQPMHYETITELALDQGLIQTTGLTPAATMYSVIYAENRRRDSRGQPARFVMHGKGLVGLGAWVSQGLAAQIEAHNRGVREALLARVMEGSPQEFEELVGELLVALGVEDVVVTRLSGDNGIDVRGTLVVGEVVRIKTAVQAKRWKANVQAPTVQQVRGALGAHEQGLIITTSDFSSGAITEAARGDATPVALMNGEQLAALLAEHEIGVRRDQHPLYYLDAPEEPEA